MQLVFKQEGSQTGRAEIGPGRPLLRLGRHPECDIHTKDPTVSRRHAEFTWSEGRLVVKDLGSTSGTHLGGRKVGRAQLQVGDVVLCGSFEVRVEDSAGGGQAAPAAATPGGGEWALVFEDEDGAERKLIMEQGCEPVLVGRRAECHVRTRNPTVGRQHARFCWDGGRLTLDDLQSSNGTFVDGERVTRRVLAPGELVTCGTFEVRVVRARGGGGAAASGLSDEAWEASWGEDWGDEDEMGPPIWHLVFREDDGATRVTCATFGPGARLMAVGSDPSCEIYSRQPGVEPDHCELVWEEGTLVLSDLDTDSGTLINGRSVAEVVLRNRDLVSCGDFRLRVVRGSAAESGSTTSSAKFADLDEWPAVLRRREPSICLTYTVFEPRRLELTLWGDGEARIELERDGERMGVDGTLDDSVLGLVFSALARAGFPRAPGDAPQAGERPAEVAVFEGSLEACVLLSDRTVDRSPAYRELDNLLEAISDEIRGEP